MALILCQAYWNYGRAGMLDWSSATSTGLFRYLPVIGTTDLCIADQDHLIPMFHPNGTSRGASRAAHTMAIAVWRNLEFQPTPSMCVDVEAEECWGWNHDAVELW